MLCSVVKRVCLSWHELKNGLRCNQRKKKKARDMGGRALFLSSSFICALINSETSRIKQRRWSQQKDSPVQSSYQGKQLLSLQDVLLYLVCIGLHARDQQSQVIGLSSEWKHKSQSTQVKLDHPRSLSFPCTWLLNAGTVGTSKAAALLGHNCGVKRGSR